MCLQAERFGAAPERRQQHMTFASTAAPVACSSIHAVKVARGSVVVEYRTLANSTFADTTKRSLTLDAVSVLNSTLAGSQYLKVSAGC